jgi:hypothetical protein|mmetsp:Transcript_85929/g.135667  ORF Transcript_85929/g.135667 Transcript_85929/m.135667 type:complete len:1020 (-) Transcript_85929:124-3183(-)|eukprot:CAMPEP_0169084140 /NCGR_PEP_ID=MMETSP1015-20121227/12459_1 /TAXON_ID=342587 /ORGANISM="Karlodinium micrum, Strain CCMP2283" /LENGTH=1019 /DNA_ID=CAMNT_0009144123 /DNA_START=40 /DNA_END=3099 /DNA_ORIENTATION=+
MEKEVPWCAIFLVVAALSCHTLVLIGNYETASAMNSIGESTRGWSKVGIGLSRSFKSELDEYLHNISGELTEVINETLVVQKYLDIVVSVVGNATEQSQAKQASLLQAGNVSTDLTGNLTAATEALSKFVMSGVKEAMDKAIEELAKLIDSFFDKIKPTLIKVGALILKFGDKLTQALEGFSNGLDKVQKIFDQVMAQLAGKAHNATSELMIHDTFNLFDVSHTGSITVDDLKEVGELYGISALQGSKPEVLLRKYDANGDKELSNAEFRLFVEDTTIPNSMSVVLRAYAKRLTAVAGNVESARMRDEAALSVTKYFQLVCAKNRTKLGWVADALGNGSLPLQFTADVFKNLAEQVDNPDVLTTADVGQVVISEMMKLHPKETLQAVDLMSNASFWTSEGFDPSDHPLAIQRVSAWVAKSPISLLQEGDQDYIGVELLDAMPAMARIVAEENMARHLKEKHSVTAARRSALFATDSSKYLLHHLYGGVAPSDSAGSAKAERCVQSGVPALPATLQFAQWLSNNASSTAKRFQHQCMEYAGTSSSTLDSFATQIQGMVKKITSFIKMMEKYSTDTGISSLEQQLKGSTLKMASDMEKVVTKKIQKFVDSTCPKISSAADSALDIVAQKLAAMVTNLTSEPLINAMEGPLEKALGQALNNTEAGNLLAGLLGNVTEKKLANLTNEVLVKQISDFLNKTMYKALDEGIQKMESISEVEQTMENKSELIAIDTEVSLDEQEAFELEIHGSFSQIASTFRELMNFLPQATDNLKFARQEVGEVAKIMDSVFTNFETKGPAIFEKASESWTLIWTLYFIFLLPMTLGMLPYAFWASGWLGGPGSKDDLHETTDDAKKSCWSACTYCLTGFHDTALCFWSCVILLEIVCLLLFVISILFCVLAGLKEFMVAGCSQVYMLADDKICYETVKVLRDFQSTFYVTSPDTPLEDVCGYNQLLTCNMISEKLKVSGIFTTVFSFLAVIFSFQLIIQSAMLHTRAQWRRKIGEAEETVTKGESTQPISSGQA